MMDAQQAQDREIVSWFEKLCFTCISCIYEYDDGEHSIAGYFYCDKEHSASHLSFFPNMKTPRNCDNFNPKWAEERRADYLDILINIEEEFGGQRLHYDIAKSVTDFNARMGNYDNCIFW